MICNPIKCFVKRFIRICLDLFVNIIGLIYPSERNYLPPITDRLLLEPVHNLVDQIKKGHVRHNKLIYLIIYILIIIIIILYYCLLKIILLISLWFSSKVKIWLRHILTESNQCRFVIFSFDDQSFRGLDQSF